MTDKGKEATSQRVERRRQFLRTPRAAAIAGILFAVLFITSVGMMRLAIPEEITISDTTTWLQTEAERVRLALTLVPFAGIAFLWFMGVVRSHLGQMEDQFFATVFFGSGLLFLAMIFTTAAVAGGILSAYALAPDALEESGTITFGRAIMYTITNVYAIRMAGVFMISLGTIWVRTRTMPRVMVIMTYLLAIVLLVVINLSLWV
ncbi:MAG: hypothetical protein IPK16_29170, partial [Anaerolineales bacterium]|nr:hypothetical protein [Anaerolineales bacterium]